MSVKVTKHPTTGDVVTQSTKNPEWGTLRVDSENKSFSGGILNVSKRSAFIRGRMADLQAMNFRDGQVLQGKIQKQESFEPFYEGQNPKINPTTNEVVLTNGKQSFIQFEYVEDPNTPDVWMGTTSNEVSKEVEDALKEQAV